MGRQTKSIVDGKGRPIQAQTAGLEPVNYEYDVRGRVKVVTQGTGIASRTTNFTYNNAGFLETITDPLGRMMRFNYDAAGRVIEQITPDNRSIISAYDANGNATGVIPPGRPAHTFSYTPVDLTSIYTPPDIGPGSEATVNTFNADRQLTRVALPNGQNMDLGFDGASGRLTNVTIARGQINYGYVASSGNLASVSAPDETQTFTYDGSLPTLMRWTGAVPGEVNRSYDNNFRTTTEVLSGTDTVSFQYDNDDLLIGAGSLTLTRNSQNGRVTTTTLGNVTDSFGYSSFGEMTSYSAAFAGLSVYSAQYARDNLGRIIQKTEMIGGVTDTFNYSYDLAGRLTEVRKNGSVTSTYTYDANGNRLSGPSATTTYTYDDQDRLLATTNTSAMFTLPVGRQIEYLVDGRNRRIGKKINGTIVQKFLYSGRLTPIAELDGNNNLISRFVYSTGANVPAYMIKGGTTYRIITDHLGSPRLIINVSTGLVVQRMDYDEFGNVTNDTNPSFQPFGFAGGLYDSDAKFVRFGARDYDSRMGRWIAKDPIGLDGGDTNLYSYVFNEPINHTDPLGMVGVPDWFIKACEKAGVATELIEELWGRLYGTFKHNLRPMIGTGGGLTLFLQRLGWSARYLPQLGCISTELLFFLGRVSLIVGYVAVLDWQTEQVEPEVRATLERNREAGIPGLTIMDSIRLRGR
jgi:RHS repeat-associated protein